jgi:hypothetical protein
MKRGMDLFNIFVKEVNPGYEMKVADLLLLKLIRLGFAFRHVDTMQAISDFLGLHRRCEAKHS